MSKQDVGAPIRVTISEDHLHCLYAIADRSVYVAMAIARGAKDRGEVETVSECVSYARAANWERRYAAGIMRNAGISIPHSLRPFRAALKGGGV